VLALRQTTSWLLGVGKGPRRASNRTGGLRLLCKTGRADLDSGSSLKGDAVAEIDRHPSKGGQIGAVVESVRFASRRAACGALRRPAQRRQACQGRRPMSLDLQKMIWDDPEPKGSAKLVLLCLGSFVSHDAWKQGRDLLAWPSQNTLARRCGIQRSTVERALKELLKLRKIADTGRRKQRRSVVYELYPSTAPVLPDPGAGDLPGSEASDDMPDPGAGGGGLVSDLPDSAHDLPDPEDDLPDSAASTCPNLQHKRVRKGLEESELGETKRAQARASVGVEDLSEALAEVEELLKRRPADKLLNRRRKELQQATDIEFVDATAGSTCQ